MPAASGRGRTQTPAERGPMLEDGLVIELSRKLIEHLKAGGVAEEDLSLEAAAALARALYGRRILSLGLAAELADVPRDEFVADIARRGLPLIDLPAEEVERELEAVDALLSRKKAK